MLVPAVHIHLTWFDLFKSALGGTITVAVEIEHDGDACHTVGGDCDVSGPAWWPRPVQPPAPPRFTQPIDNSDLNSLLVQATHQARQAEQVGPPKLVVVPMAMLPTDPAADALIDDLIAERESRRPGVLIGQAAGHAPLV